MRRSQRFAGLLRMLCRLPPISVVYILRWLYNVVTSCCVTGVVSVPPCASSCQCSCSYISCFVPVFQLDYGTFKNLRRVGLLSSVADNIFSATSRAPEVAILLLLFSVRPEIILQRCVLEILRCRLCSLRREYPYNKTKLK